MSIYKQNKTNTTTENSGVWYEYGVNDDKSLQKFLLARAGNGNVKYAAAMRRISQKYSRALQMNALSEEVADKVSMEAFVDTVLLGWDGITDADGKVMTYSKPAAIKLLTDLPDVYAALRDFAGQAANFR